jgi:hypothetical protein
MIWPGASGAIRREKRRDTLADAFLYGWFIMNPALTAAAL